MWNLNIDNAPSLAHSIFITFESFPLFLWLWQECSDMSNDSIATGKTGLHFFVHFSILAQYSDNCSLTSRQYSLFPFPIWLVAFCNMFSYNFLCTFRNLQYISTWTINIVDNFTCIYARILLAIGFTKFPCMTEVAPVYWVRI